MRRIVCRTAVAQKIPYCPYRLLSLPTSSSSTLSSTLSSTSTSSALSSHRAGDGNGPIQGKWNVQQSRLYAKTMHRGGAQRKSGSDLAEHYDRQMQRRELSPQHMMKLKRWKESRKVYLQSEEYEEAHEEEEEEKEKEKMMRRRKKQHTPPRPEKLPRLRAKVRQLEYGGPMSVKNLAEELGVNPHKLCRFLPEGITIHDRICMETIENLCLELRVVPVNTMNRFETELKPFQGKDDPTKAPKRSPVVVIMGHVDHGKTTLLDTLRSSNVAQKEAGHITQHIGAFTVKLPNTEDITFIDTPGHEAFVAMRAAGAQVTDIIVLVVACDDGVQPQTMEAIHHARDAGVPIIVALNKIDKHNSNPDRAINDLMAQDVIPEEMGGSVQMVRISGLNGTNVDKLLEEIALQAELLDLCAMQKGCRAEGTVIESRVDRGMGITSTVIMKRGILKPGMWVVTGTTYGRIRSIKDDKSKVIKEGLPAMPVEIFGMDSMPAVGDTLLQVENSSEAEKIIARRLVARNLLAEDRNVKQQEERFIEMAKKKKELTNIMLLENDGKEKKIFGEDGTVDVTATAAAAKAAAAEMAENVKKKVQDEFKDMRRVLPIVFKADVQGTIEAFHEIISGFPMEEAYVQIVRQGVGSVSEADIDHARALGAHVVTMNVKTNAKVQQHALAHKVPLHSYRVIYHLIDYLKGELSKILPQIEKEVVVGEARVKQAFDYEENHGGKKAIVKIAGCEVTKGELSTKAHFFRVMRWNNTLLENVALSSLQRFKDKVKKVEKGLECGVSLASYDEPKQDDIIQAIEVQVSTRSFDELLEEHRRKHGTKWQAFMGHQQKQYKKRK